jgi:hypothetical protein
MMLVGIFEMERELGLHNDVEDKTGILNVILRPVSYF